MKKLMIIMLFSLLLVAMSSFVVKAISADVIEGEMYPEPVAVFCK